MIVVYVAGPLTTGACRPGGSFNSWIFEQNVRRAEELAIQLTLAGFAAICVHSMARYAFGHIPETLAMEADFEIIRRCDALVLVEGWQVSKGTLAELQHARQLHMPVFGEKSEYIGIARVREICDEMAHWAAERVTQEIDDPETKENGKGNGV